MATVKNNAIIAENLLKVPVNVISMAVKLVLKPKFRRDAVDPIDTIGDVKVSELPETVTKSFLIERLKGMWYDNHQLVEFMKDPLLEQFYLIEGNFKLSSRGGEVVEATLNNLTSGASLITWMEKNAIKLYLTPLEQKLKASTQDRNYSELVGEVGWGVNVHKANVSATDLKNHKADVKDSQELNETLAYHRGQESPRRQANKAIHNLEGMGQKVLEYREYKEFIKEERKQQKLLNLK